MTAKRRYEQSGKERREGSRWGREKQNKSWSSAKLELGMMQVISALLTTFTHVFSTKIDLSVTFLNLIREKTRCHVMAQQEPTTVFLNQHTNFFAFSFLYFLVIVIKYVLNWIIFSILTSKPWGYLEKMISKWIWLCLADTIAVYYYH